MHKHGGDVYTYKNVTDFSANINPLGTPQRIIDAVTAGAKLAAQYPDVQCRELRAALSSFEDIPRENIICGNGAADLIFSIVLASKPRKALMLAPTFYEYEQALRAVDCRIDYHILREEDDFKLGADYLDKLDNSLDIIFICNPNNPTGLLTEPKLLHRILKKCQENSILFVLDECFNDFLDEPEKYTLKAELKNHKNLFILKAFTKLYAMAGIRLGYGFSSNMQLLAAMEEVTQPWSVSTPAQYAGLAALEEKEYVAKTKEIIFQERKYLAESLQGLGLKVYPGNANYLFFKGPVDLSEKIREKGYMIRDCGNYHSLNKGFYRIAVKLHEDNCGLIKALESIVL
ncbi:MAG: pyridoxal phosphate-dependent class II aminotransferase [Bacillota bacterium]|nr:pyridoxal phosphate-dependent class II aminotransferase [Bacillota bacterium]